MSEQNERRNSKHHVTPRSRARKGNNNNEAIVCLPESFHRAWHIVFGNLYGEEIIFFVEEINSLMKIRTTITGLDLKEIRGNIKKRGMHRN